MIEGMYVTHPTSPADHSFNYFVCILEHAVAHGDLDAVGAYKLALEHELPQRYIPELGTIANSTKLNLNGLLRLLFRPEDHENCTSGWL